MFETRAIDEPHHRESELAFCADDAAWIVICNEWGWAMGATAELKVSRQEMIRNVVDREAKKFFHDVGVGRSYIYEDDYRGVVHIVIVVDDVRLLETNDTVGFIWHIEEALETELKEEFFPLIWYIDKGDEKSFVSRTKDGFYT